MTYIKISTTSFSAASTVNVDNVFSAAYTHYLVVRNLSGVAAGNSITMRLRVAAADDTGANYRYQYVNASATLTAGARVTAATSWSDAALGVTETTAIGYAMLRVSNPFDTVRTTAWTDTSNIATGNILLSRYVWAHDLATSYTGFSLICATNMTGNVTVYGLKES